MKEDGQSTQIYEPSETIVEHFDSSYLDTTWPSGNKDSGAGSIIAKRRDKWIQPTLAALKRFFLGSSCKEVVGLWALHCMVNGLHLYDAFILRALPPELLLCPLSLHKLIHRSHTLKFLCRIVSPIVSVKS